MYEIFQLTISHLQLWLLVLSLLFWFFMFILSVLDFRKLSESIKHLSDMVEYSRRDIRELQKGKSLSLEDSRRELSFIRDTLLKYRFTIDKLLSESDDLISKSKEVDLTGGESLGREAGGNKNPS
jgi:hypothetical protein